MLNYGRFCTCKMEFYSCYCHPHKTTRETHLYQRLRAFGIVRGSSLTTYCLKPYILLWNNVSQLSTLISNANIFLSLLVKDAHNRLVLSFVNVHSFWLKYVITLQNLWTLRQICKYLEETKELSERIKKLMSKTYCGFLPISVRPVSMRNAGKRWQKNVKILNISSEEVTVKVGNHNVFDNGASLPYLKPHSRYLFHVTVLSSSGIQL